MGNIRQLRAIGHLHIYAISRHAIHTVYSAAGKRQAPIRQRKQRWPERRDYVILNLRHIVFYEVHQQIYPLNRCQSSG